MSLEKLAQILFWFSGFVVLYVYLGYPLLVYCFSRLSPKRIVRGPVEPKVSIIITAYNEESSIRAKIENSLNIDYPKEKLEIMVASDGSNDGTDTIVNEFYHRGVKLFRQEGRVGKTFTQNKAVEEAGGEIILFSDATTMYQPNVLQSLLPNFADRSVGCVAGRLVYVDLSESAIGAGAKSYWNYETLLKKSESQACSLIGVSGCLYAVRKSLYIPMYPEACSDFLICTLLYRQGFRTVYEPNAICTEFTNKQTDQEFEMRVRVIAQTFTDLWRNRDMLNPFKSGIFGIQLVSHKLLRYAAPAFLVSMLISSGGLAFSSILFLIIFVLQSVFYSIAAVGWILESRDVKIGILSSPLYFVLANLSSVVGFYKFVKGEKYARWETVR